MKRLILLAILLPACQATRPLRQPPGLGLAKASAAVVSQLDRPDLTARPLPLRMAAAPFRLVYIGAGMVVAIPLFAGGVAVYPEMLSAGKEDGK